MSFSINGFLSFFGRSLFEIGVSANYRNGDSKASLSAPPKESNINARARYQRNEVFVDGNVSCRDANVNATTRIGHEQLGALRADYNNQSRNTSLSYEPSQRVERLSRYGPIGAAIASATATYMSTPADNEYRLIGSIAVGCVFGLLAYLARNSRREANVEN